MTIEELTKKQAFLNSMFFILMRSHRRHSPESIHNLGYISKLDLYEQTIDRYIKEHEKLVAEYESSSK